MLPAIAVTFIALTTSDLQMSKHALRSSTKKESKCSLNTSNDDKKMNAYKGHDRPNRMVGKNVTCDQGLYFSHMDKGLTHMLSKVGAVTTGLWL